MTLLFQSPYIEALGWSLIDSLWQMGAIWLFYVVVTGNGNRFTAAMRHSLALLATATGTFTFIFSLLLNYYCAINNQSLFSLAYFAGQQATGLFHNTFAKTIVPFLSLIYIPAVAYSFFKLVYQVNAHRNLYRHQLSEPGDEVMQFVKRILSRFGIAKTVSVWISERVQSPLTLGFWKPLVVLPLAVFSQLSCKQVEAVIVHEMYHVKRNDYLLNIFLSIIEVMLFFNPFARLLAGIVKKERENSCDDTVIAMGYDAWDYSQALYILGKYRFHGHLAVAATGAGKEYLLQRIKRMMNRKNSSPSIWKPLTTFFLCLIVAGITSRNSKQVPVLATTADEARPAKYYYEEKTVTFDSPRRKVNVRDGATSQTGRHLEKAPSATRQARPTPAVPTPPPPPPNEPAADLVPTYVAAPELMEFTMIDHHKPVQPDRTTLERPHPYVPASSFYYTEIDTTTSKSVIKL